MSMRFLKLYLDAERFISGSYSVTLSNMHADKEPSIIRLLKVFLIKFNCENNDSQQYADEKIDRIAIANLFKTNKSIRNDIPCFQYFFFCIACYYTESSIILC